jgi:hypothetical protein
MRPENLNLSPNPLALFSKRRKRRVRLRRSKFPRTTFL